jgi:hypothetical protein
LLLRRRLWNTTTAYAREGAVGTEGSRMKVVINRCFGGFGLSEKAETMLAATCAIHHYHYADAARSCPALVAIVETLGEEANGNFAELRVINVPKSVKWHIDDYDGMESVHELHRVWDGDTPTVKRRKKGAA